MLITVHAAASSAAMPSGSALREDIDRTLLRFSEDGTYRELYIKWFGVEEAA